MKTISVLLIKITVAFAAVILLFTCSTPDEPVTTEVGASDRVAEIVSHILTDMKSVGSYRVDGTITTYLPGGAEHKRITMRGDWVGPDRLEWDVSGLRHNRAEYLIIVGDRAYQRERNTSTRDWSKWVEFNTNSVDPAYTGGLLELTLGLDEYLSRIPWSSAIAEPEYNIRLKGTLSEDAEGTGRIVKSYDMRVPRVGYLPLIKTKHLIREVYLQVIDHSGSERVVVQEASYEFSLFTHPLEVEPPLP